MDPRIVALHKAAIGRPGVIGLAGGLPAAELMPRAELARALADVAASHSSVEDPLQYGWPEGSAALRAWIAARLASRGAAIDPARVIVTTGAQQALGLAAASLAVGGRRIAVGDATYAAAIDAFAAAGARVVRDGGVARYLIAGASNPHGIDLVDRAAVLASGDALIVDEAYAELRFDGRVPRPLLADAPDRVWHVGTIAKTLCPGLRVGWLIPPAAHRGAVLARKHVADLQTASVTQAALVRLVEQIDHDAAIARARRFYATRCARMTDALRRHLPGIAFAEPEGGFSIWLETDERGDDVALLAAAIANGIAFDPGSAFRPEPVDRIALRLSFSAVAEAAIEPGVQRLAQTLAGWHRRRAA